MATSQSEGASPSEGSSNVEQFVRDQDGHYICTQCGRQYMTEARVLRHVHDHISGGKTCNECGHVCGSEKALLEHIQKHSGDFACFNCGHKFGSQSKLDKHMASSACARR